MKRGTKGLLLLLAAALVAAAALALPESAEAQCALCKLSAASGGPRAVRALAVGVVVLLVPPVAIFCSIFVVAYRRGKSGPADDAPHEG
ncbi:MAG TPA: hypothetical protein VGV38_04020 [Pyrinomonadaceae bacterium]|nr:hypothetical protein [Pyrinomonadaceae bacterium]